MNIDLQQFRDAVAAVARGTAGEHRRVVLDHGAPGSLIVEASTGDYMAGTSIGARTGDDQPGRVVVDHSDLAAVLRVFPTGGAAALTIHEASAVIDAGWPTVMSASIPAAREHDRPDAIATTFAGPIDAATFDMLCRVSAAASDDQARPVLTNLNVDDGQVAATDGYRLAHGPVDLPAMTIPASLPRLFRAAFGTPDRISHTRHDLPFDVKHAVMFTNGAGWCYAASRTTPNFPAWRTLLPADDEPRTVVLSASSSQWKRALNATAWLKQHVVISGNDSGTFDVSNGWADWIKANRLTLKVANAGTVVGHGAGVIVAFNPTFLLDGISAAGGQDVDVWIRSTGAGDDTGRMKPAVIEGAGGFRYLLMIVRT